MSREEKLAEFVGWAQHHITGDEKGQAQIFLDRLVQAFGHPGVLEVGGQLLPLGVPAITPPAGGTLVSRCLASPATIKVFSFWAATCLFHHSQASWRVQEPLAAQPPSASPSA